MAAKAQPILRFDPCILNQLACPVCRGDLSLAGPRIVCAGCNRAYPVVDGIPVLIAERAELPQAVPGLLHPEGTALKSARPTGSDDPARR